MTCRPPSSSVLVSRAPTALRSARTRARCPAEPAPGPRGHSSHGPSPQRGWLAYSSCTISSLPGPASTGEPSRRSVMASVPPRAGSAVTLNRSFSIRVPAAGRQPAPSESAPDGPAR